MTDPKPLTEIERDIAWLERFKENGHCGEGNIERSARYAINDRVGRLLAIITTARSAAPAGGDHLPDVGKMVVPEGWVLVPRDAAAIDEPYNSIVKSWGLRVQADANTSGDVSAVFIGRIMLTSWSKTQAEAEAYTQGFNRAQSVFAAWIDHYAMLSATPPKTGGAG